MDVLGIIKKTSHRTLVTPVRGLWIRWGRGGVGGFLSFNWLQSKLKSLERTQKVSSMEFCSEKIYNKTLLYSSSKPEAGLVFVNPEQGLEARLADKEQIQEITATIFSNYNIPEVLTQISAVYLWSILFSFLDSYWYFNSKGLHATDELNFLFGYGGFQRQKWLWDK